MAIRLRPQNHTERQEIVQALATLQTTDDHPGIGELLRMMIGSRAQEWSRARADYARARSKVQVASDAADDADAQLDAAFRRWHHTVLDSEGRIQTDALTRLLGRSPSRVLSAPYPEEVDRIRQLLISLEEQPSLQGDTEALALVRLAVDALARADEAESQAARALLKSGEALTAATPAFDRAYSRFVRALKALFSEDRVQELLPRFIDENSDDSADDSDNDDITGREIPEA